MDCPLACPGPEHLTAAGRVGQGSVITSHRPEPNIEIAARLTKTRLRFSLVPADARENTPLLPVK